MEVAFLSSLGVLAVVIAMLLWQNHRIVRLAMLDHERRAAFMTQDKDPLVREVVAAIKAGKIPVEAVTYDPDWESTFNRRSRGDGNA